jgi:hypothetical protein
MNIVDLSGWIKYIAGMANADFFEPAILDSNNLFIPTICLYAVFKLKLTFFRRTLLTRNLFLPNIS